MASSSNANSVPVSAFITELESLIAQAMNEWKIPGLAVAIVQDGAVALLKPFGQRDVEAGLPVTSDTQFTICSITKTFTSTGLALLVDERLLDWTKPVREYIPEFRLHDAVATERITVRDLLCHHWGLPRHDWIHMPGDLSRAQMLAVLRYLEPSEDIRNVFQYQNLGYVAAGAVAERISGLSWEEFTRTRLTDKLRMAVSFAAEAMAQASDAAVPYAMDADTRLRTQHWPITTTQSGALNTSIAGIANWMRFHLDRGEFDGQRLLSPALIAEMQKPRVYTMTSEFAEIGEHHYGLGFSAYHYRGERAVAHGGGWIGWGTLMTLLPERGIGVAVFTNRDPSPVTEIVTNFVLDRVCGKAPVPWLQRFRERRRSALAQLETDRAARRTLRRAGTRPSHELADYVGEYAHPAYGRIVITRAGDGLHWSYRGLTAPLAHRHYDTFELPEVAGRLFPDRLPLSFSTDRDGNVASLCAPFEPMVKDIVFVRTPAGDCMDASFRAACAGMFRHGQLTHAVALDGNGDLTLKPANQPTYRLRPYQGSTFTIVELPEFRIEFRRGPDGAVDELIFHQPNGVFVAKRVEAGA